MPLPRVGGAGFSVRAEAGREKRPRVVLYPSPLCERTREASSAPEVCASREGILAVSCCQRTQAEVETHHVVRRLAGRLDAQLEVDGGGLVVLRIPEDDEGLLRLDARAAVRHGKGELEGRCGGEGHWLGPLAILDGIGLLGAVVVRRDCARGANVELGEGGGEQERERECSAESSHGGKSVGDVVGE
jgi:hypothetical protein